MNNRSRFVIAAAALAVGVFPSLFAADRQISVDEFRDRMQGAWLGQSVGVAYGWPTEFCYSGKLVDEDKMPVWKPELVNETFNQDDLYVEMTFVDTLLRRGVNVTSRAAGIDFANSAYRLWCANHNARTNLRRGLAAPASSHPEYHRTTDDIDYQIEADFSGILAPGLPQASVDLGETFGRIMNYGDGLYAGQFVGALYAEAYFSTNCVEIVERALNAIPAESKYAGMVRDMLAWHRADPQDWKVAWRKAVEKYQSTNTLGSVSFQAIDVKINGAMVLLGVLYGNGDLARTMYISTAGGFDSDCNPSSACGVVGTMLGFKRMEADYFSAFDRTKKWEFTDFTWDGLVAASDRLVREIVVKYGGTIEKNASGAEILTIPVRDVRPSAFFDSKNPGPVPADARLTAEELAQIRYRPGERAGESSILIAEKPLPVVPYPVSLKEMGGWVQKDLAVKYVTDASVTAEGYRLSIRLDGITVTSSDEAGRFYAGETLKQLLDSGWYPCVEIEDAPRYRWRGVHLDEGRHFFGKEEVLKTLDLMAMHKLNRFHWHLTEDQGWRLDIPGYPDLVKYGAVRSASPKHGTHPHVDQSQKNIAKALDGRRYGPFYYTEADVKEIVAYAKARQIEIVPEIELPGHFQAVLAAYPAFACEPDPSNRDPLCAWGISKNVMCLGNDEAIRFMENVLDYVTKLFPYEVVHIGGDECPMVRWKTCPKCQARIKSENLGDEHGLQPWITRHFVKFLAARGKRALGWDEYLLGDVPPDAIGMSWRVGGGGAGHMCRTPGEWAAKGHDIVMTPTEFCYLDYAQGLKEDPFQYIGGKLPLEKVYSLDPCAGVAEKDRAHILGGQGNNWAEYTWNEYDLEWKMWPRQSALAEVFWTGEKRPDFANFKARMRTHRSRLIRRNVNCAPLE